LPVDFPPLKTLDARPNNLQTQPTLLLGRSEEVKEICARFREEDVRLLTLTGPGGTGKTRLSLQVAADLLDDYKDGVYFVALAPISDPTLVASTIAQTLGLKEVGGRPILETLREYLRDRSMLLVLDNFEQITGAAPEIADLLAGTSQLKILVTSRVPLHVRGEHEFAVSPLAVPDHRHLPELAVLSQYAAVRLFVERARAVKPDFAVNNDNAPAVAEICVRLDGLPLAIELAAARVKLLSPQAMLVRLEHPLKFLTGGARELSARQQTLRATIAWSYDLLHEDEKRLFRRLGVFAGGCTLEAAEAVCNAKGDLDIEVLDGVASLADKSLLKQIEGTDGEPRFFMLETIREYALERLTESGENEEWKRQQADYFLNLAEQAEIELRGFQQRKWYERLDVEQNNLRAALDWLIRSNEAQNGLRLAGALAEFWWVSGHLGEALKTFDLLFALPEASQPTAARAKALMAAAQIMAYSDSKKANLWLEESVRIYRELGDKGGLALAIGHLGDHLLWTGEHARGRALAEQSVVMFRESGDRWGLACALAWLGDCANFQGEIIVAGEALEESIRLRREMGDGIRITFALGLLGSARRMQGEPEKARSLYEEGLIFAREASFPTEIASRLSNLAQLAFRVGDYSRVAELAKASVDKFEETGSQKPWIAEAQFLLGELARRQGDDEEARSHYNDFLATAKASGGENLIAGAFTRLGQVALESDKLDEARRCYAESLVIQRKLGAKTSIAQTLKLLGDLAHVETRHDEAQRLYDEGLKLARESGSKEGLAALLGELGLAALDQSDNARALDLWNEQLTLNRELESKIGMAWSPSNLGLVALYQGRFDEASGLFEESLTSFRALGLTHGIARALLRKAMVKQAQGDLAKARSVLEESVALFRRATGADGRAGSQGTRDVAHALQGLARVALAQGDIPSARAALKEGISISHHRFDKRGIAESLGGFARLALAEGDAERAARLFGAAEALHKIIGPRLNPFDHHDQASVLATLCSKIAEETFTAALAKGRALAREQAIAYALED
jgi:predicted ATPase